MPKSKHRKEHCVPSKLGEYNYQNTLSREYYEKQMQKSKE